MWPFKKKREESVSMDEVEDYEPTRWEKFWWPIERRLKDIYWAIRWTPRNIARLISYLPVIWQDRDYDHCFVLYLLEHKLRRMYKRWGNPPRYVGEEKDKWYMRKCLIILNRIIENNYLSEEWENEKLPSPSFRKEWNEKYGDGLRRAGTRADEREAADWHALWYILEHQLRKWWD